MKNKKIVTSVIIAVLSIFLYSNAAFADYYSSQVTLYQGMRNSEVVNLQNDLKRLGYFGYSSTGYFGSLTRQSVIQFQMDNYLVPDGVVGLATAREIKVEKVIQTAKQYQGVPYVWGGVSPSGFDCSGFTHYVFLQNGIIVPRTAADQYNQGTWVPRSQLRPGDLVFFSTYKPGPSHMGIYLGSNKFIQAGTSSGVAISDLSFNYWAQRYIGARRIIR